MWATPQELRALTCQLVGWGSVTGSEGEARFPERVAGLLRSCDAFRDRPELVELGAVEGAPSYVTALHRAEGVADTILLLSHFDTVDTAEYGPLEHLATDPEQLTQALASGALELDAAAAADLASGEWLFGRGVMDMKAGLALHMALLERAEAEGWPINLLLLTVPDEEVNSAGMRAAVERLGGLADAHGLRFRLFLNSEPSFPAHPGDGRHHVYTGSIGKILPAALVAGHETHAGAPLAGLTSTWIASYLTQAMEWSDAFREEVHGEATPLPVTLLQRDLRDGYSTQTTSRTAALFNVFVMERTAQDVLARFVEVARSAARRCNDDYHAVCEREGVPPVGELRVITFAELEERAAARLGREAVDALAAEAAAACTGDVRDASIAVADALLAACSELAPAVVLLFAPPYYPAVNSSDDALVRACVARVQEQASSRFGVDLVQTHWFNGISDLSYLAYGGAPSSSEAYERNTPGEGYRIPFDAMRALDAPVLNVGPLGTAPHQRTERLHARSAFEQLPELLADLVQFVAARPADAEG